MQRIRKSLAGICLSVLVLAAARAAPPQQEEQYELRGRHVAVFNLAGQATIRAGSGDAVVVTVRRAGDDARELEVVTGPIGGRETLRVIYPADRVVYRTDNDRYESTIRVREDGTFGDGDRERRRSSRRRIEIHGSGRGMDAYADITIDVPTGQQFNLYWGVGEIAATNVDGEIRLDSHSGSVETSGSRGRLVIDTGSGRVRVTDATGDVDIDTGSGSVNVSGVRGENLRIDTGSGQITASRVTVNDLNLDTGSGGIDLTAASAEIVLLDTGSGSVDAVLVGGARDVEVDTGSGSVDLTLPAGFAGSLEVDTGSGGIDIDFPIEVRRWERDHVTGRVGSGNGRLLIDTGSGDVTVRKR